MKFEKKHVGTKAKIRVEKERERKIAKAIFITLILLIIILSGYFGYSYLNQSQNQTLNQESSQPKAAIVDQLSLTFPNRTFIETATNILKQAGYIVDYFPGEKVTVDFYRNLPLHGYKIIILRVHSTATNPDMSEGPVTLFTSEPYSQTKYVYEQLTDQLVKVAYSNEGAKKEIFYFGINPPFVTSSMRGKFQNAMVIMMGCEGLDNTLMAQAFIQKGASVYISWNKGVTASHTDSATTHLLQHFVIEKMTVKQAIQETYKELGADPLYKSLLMAYPLEALNYTIDDITKQ